MIGRVRPAATLAAILSLAGCGGGGSGNTLSSTVPPPFNASPGTTVQAKVRIVGVGDSLVAG